MELLDVCEGAAVLVCGHKNLGAQVPRLCLVLSVALHALHFSKGEADPAAKEAGFDFTSLAPTAKGHGCDFPTGCKVSGGQENRRICVACCFHATPNVHPNRVLSPYLSFTKPGPFLVKEPLPLTFAIKPPKTSGLPNLRPARFRTIDEWPLVFDRHPDLSFCRSR